MGDGQEVHVKTLDGLTVAHGPAAAAALCPSVSSQREADYINRDFHFLTSAHGVCVCFLFFFPSKGREGWGLGKRAGGGGCKEAEIELVSIYCPALLSLLLSPALHTLAAFWGGGKKKKPAGLKL